MKNTFSSTIIFDDSKQQYEILDGTKGIYKYSDISRVAMLNEKANYKGKGVPFTAILPSGPLPSGILSYPYLYVGIKVVLKNNSILAIYVSKNKTMVNTDQYIADKSIAKEILKKFNEIIKEG